VGGLAADLTKPGQLRNIALHVHVLRVMLQKIGRKVVDSGVGPADGGVGHAGLDALADHVALHLGKHAPHLEHPVRHGIQLVPAVDDERADDQLEPFTFGGFNYLAQLLGGACQPAAFGGHHRVSVPHGSQHPWKSIMVTDLARDDEGHSAAPLWSIRISFHLK